MFKLKPIFKLQIALDFTDSSIHPGLIHSSSADVPKWGLYGVAEQKGVWRTVLYNGFRFVLGYRNWPTLNTQWRQLS